MLIAVGVILFIIFLVVWAFAMGQAPKLTAKNFGVGAVFAVLAMVSIPSFLLSRLFIYIDEKCEELAEWVGEKYTYE
jgi:multisubunit Na+/H+ antiporter MnhE subunit